MSAINGIKDLLDQKLEQLLAQKREEVIYAAVGAVDEGAIDDLKDQRELKKANSSSYGKVEKKATPAPKRIVKGSKYGSDAKPSSDEDMTEATEELDIAPSNEDVA
jgi:hypothetical protein